MVALGAAIIYIASGFRIGSFPDPVTTRGLSYVTGGYLIVAGLYLSIRRLLTWSAIPGKYTLSEGNEDERNHPASSLRAFTIMGLAILWAVSVTPIGFLIVTPIVLISVVWMMDVRTPGKLVGFPVVFTLATWLVFSQLLGVRLPYGIMTGLARSWGLIY
jgi:RsiW-degrading membrane proteinase PrsW (M82 family)